jgi:colanic acid biosynthesis glycosyl transferase WcaI
MKFLILTMYFPPEIGGAQTRLKSVAAELSRAGHEVEVVTALPNYPRGRIFHGYRGTFYRRELLDDIVVHRVWLYPAIGSGIKRMLNYVSFTVTSLFGMLRAKKPDYLFVESPPLFLGIPAYIAGLLWGVPFIFNVADLWPDAIVDGGFLKEGFVLRCLSAIESWSYRKAAYVNAVTEGIREVLVEKKSVAHEKVLFLPNGADTIRFQPRPIDVSFKRELGLEGKRIVLWAGTLGFAHGLEYVLRAAKLLEAQEDIHFLFVGDGSAKAALNQLRKDLDLRNVTLRDPVSLDKLPAYFSIAEAGLASLIDIPVHNGARPSKVFPILASGKPLIFIGRGEGARLVQQAKAGLVVPPQNSEAFASAVMELMTNPELIAEFGANGRKFVEENFQWSHLIRSWMAPLTKPQPRVQTATSVTQG